MLLYTRLIVCFIILYFMISELCQSTVFVRNLHFVVTGFENILITMTFCRD